MKKSLLGVAGAAAVVVGAASAQADVLQYSFETLYNEMGMPDPLGTRPDGFHTNPNAPNNFVAQDTFGVTDGMFSLRYSQIPAATFTGAITELGVPFPVINAPTTSAISMDVTIKPGEEFTGVFANLGLTEFGEHPTMGEGQAQTIAAVEQPVDLEAGTYRLVIPLIARNRPYDPFELDISFHDIVNTGANPMTPTSFQFYVNKDTSSALAIYVDNMQAVTSNSAAWKNPGDGNWSDAASWAGFPVVVPNATDATAVLSLGVMTLATITVDQPHTVGEMIFNTGGSYTIAGPSALTMDVSSGQARLAVYTGSHAISAPLVLNDDLTVNVQRSTSVLTLSGPITATGRTITKAGTGRADVSPINASGLVINAGTVKVLPDGTANGTSRVNSLTIAGGTTPTAKLDVSNNAFVVNYPPNDAEPFDTIKAQIIHAYNGGAWDQDGITSADANASTHGIGYAEASALTTIPAIFGTVDATSVLFRFTRYGDADLSGSVNLADFNRLAANFGAAGANWDQGDFNYDGNVNLQDFNRLAGNFGQSAGPDGPTPQDWANLAAAVPEPAASLFLLAAPLLAQRRRRR
ncbi:MAG: hypothetical protein L0Z50_23440 [Verrucomicrobiales bacterium]|nr:hypothetical protein [Verrucomicrobiales bacterium]